MQRDTGQNRQVNIGKLRVFRYFFYALTLGGIVFFVYARKDSFHAIRNVSTTSLPLMFATSAFSLVLNGILFNNGIAIFALRLPFKEWYGLTMANTMYSYFLPARGGLVARAFYLNYKYGFPYSDYLSFTSGTLILNLFAASFLASTIQLFLLFLQNFLLKPIFFVSILTTLILAGLISTVSSVHLKKISASNKIAHFFLNVVRGFRRFKNEPAKTASFIFLQFFFIFALALRLYVVFWALGLGVNYIHLALITSIVSFSMLFSLTPGNLGIKEALISVSANLLGVSPEEALLAAIIDRLITASLVISQGFVFTRMLLTEIEDIPK